MRRRTKISIYKPVTFKSFAQLFMHWELSCRCWARLAGENCFTVKYFGEVFPGWRCTIGGQVYEIVSVRDVLQPRSVELKLTEIFSGLEDEPAPLRNIAPRGSRGGKANTAVKGFSPWH